MREATYLRLLILSLKAGKDFVKSEESKIDKLLSKLVQTVDKTALCLTQKGKKP